MTAPLAFADSLHSESLDLAEMVINLASNIVSDLHPPAKGAERTVTSATVSERNGTITYLIQGEDVFRNGKVLSTYWLSLSKRLMASDSMYTSFAGSGPLPALGEGRALLETTKEFVGPLLNSIYDIEEMALDHSRVKLHSGLKINDEPLAFEIYGENQICKHTELNRFKISITRYVDERKESHYEVKLVHPYEGSLEFQSNL